ncbi:hypothetical protein QZM51_39290, partial [Burkholderia orbicola]
MDTLIDDSSIVSNRVVSFWGRLGSRSADELIWRAYRYASPYAFSATEMQKPPPCRAGVFGLREPDDYLLSHGNPHYHRRRVVSRSCSGWEGVG